ncbi:hypothetical protein DFA_11292 [Cavenderia fasciculata]|uniref:Uncharacterized protein n=1 Tax=Cavenderia fasciculata TaxID=261658 RepID=F4QC44_CACFS|nr:uncharacterized protein DFA_11292 [Cavenderia fasciculata]EGG13531.1 hypothetical protein DFA_11292 [Cavenderia fasciculata]|eukprot:XP_004350235.1 hypothetical protein DFA_11292 [Cavenderia fasciculata]
MSDHDIARPVPNNEWMIERIGDDSNNYRLHLNDDKLRLQMGISVPLPVRTYILHLPLVGGVNLEEPTKNPPTMMLRYKYAIYSADSWLSLASETTD